MAGRAYTIRMPRDVTVKAACEQVRCEHWLYGWDTILDERTATGRELAAWIRQHAARTYRELPGGGDGGVTVFRFEPHQRCFREHRTKPAAFIAGGQVVPTLGDWIGDLDDHFSQLSDQAQRG